MTDVAVGQAHLFYPPVILRERLWRTESIEVGSRAIFANHTDPRNPRSWFAGGYQRPGITTPAGGPDDHASPISEPPQLTGAAAVGGLVGVLAG